MRSWFKKQIEALVKFIFRLTAPDLPKDNLITIALDCMGDPSATKNAVRGALRAAKKNLRLRIILVGDEKQIWKHLPWWRPENITVHPAESWVDPKDEATEGLHNRKSSMSVICRDLVKTGKADIAVSSGNTGAYILTAKHYFKIPKAIKAPALTAKIPSCKKPFRLLDVGANANTELAHLLQSVIMAYVYAKVIDGIQEPNIFLLAPGKEKHKGDKLTVDAHQALRRSEFPGFRGNADPEDCLSGEVAYDEAEKYRIDVVVTTGFIGNVFIKVAEGMLKMLASRIKDVFWRNIWARISLIVLAIICLPLTIFLVILLKRVWAYLNPDTFDGAPIFGLKKKAVKAHGSSSDRGFENAIGIAAQFAAHPDFLEDLEEAVAHWMPLLLPATAVEEDYCI